jgi:hypothetical protein
MAFGVINVLEGTLTQQTSYFVCREFINDVLYYNNTDKSYTIYSFDGKVVSPDVLMFEDSDLLENLRSNYWLLTSIENSLFIGRSSWLDKNTLVLPGHFLQHPYVTSLWSTWIKVLCQGKNYVSLKEAFDCCTGNERHIINSDWEQHKKEIKVCANLGPFNYDLFKGLSMYVIHSTGFRAFLNSFVQKKWNKKVQEELAKLK